MAQKQEKRAQVQTLKALKVKGKVPKSKYHKCIVENINKGVSYKKAQKACEGKSRKAMSRVKGVLQSYKPYKKPNK